MTGRILTLLAMSALLSPTALVADEPADCPNILLIMTDDMGWMDLHCQGNPKLRSPQIDGLAKQGVRFTNAYAAAPVCSPTRAALMTGSYPSASRSALVWASSFVARRRWTSRLA